MITKLERNEKIQKINRSLRTRLNHCIVQTNIPYDTFLRSSESEIKSYKDSLANEFTPILTNLQNTECVGEDNQDLYSFSKFKCIRAIEDSVEDLIKTDCPSTEELVEKLRLKKVEKEEERALEKSRQAEVDKAEAAKWKSFYDSGCSFISNFSVDRKLEGQSYEITQPCFGRNIETGDCILFSGMFSQSSVRGILKTKATKFETTRQEERMFVRQKGKVKMKLSNGFDSDYYLFEEADDCRAMVEPVG